MKALGLISLPERGVCAHRGAHDIHPENSLAAFQSAVALGVHMVEFDIRLSKDGVAMVFHDSSLEKRTNGRGRVQEYTAVELRQFRLLEPDLSHVSEEGIPTLAEVLDLLPTNLWINIHLKGSGFESGKSWWKRWFKHSTETLPGYVVAQAISGSNRQHQTFLACGPVNAAAARRVLPEILLCHNRRSHVENSQFIEEAIASGARFVQFGVHRPHSAELIAQLESQGIWTTYACADDLAATRRLLKEGIRFPLANGIHTLAPHFTELGIPRLNSSMSEKR